MDQAQIVRLGVFGAVLWSLETRNRAFEKIRSLPPSASGADLQIHHAIYFAHLLGAVEHIREFIEDDEVGMRAFIENIKRGFERPAEFEYLRKIRNAIVERGLDASGAGAADGAVSFVLCPEGGGDAPEFPVQSGVFPYTVDLACRCNAATNAAIADVLEDRHLFDTAAQLVSEDAVRAAIDQATVMPGWAKAVVTRAMEERDFSEISADLAAFRVSRMHALLGCAD